MSERSRKRRAKRSARPFLLATVVGSGIMGERLAGGNVAIALLANTFATGAGLVALILTFGPISGAHFNPVVTIADAWEGGSAGATFPFTLWRKSLARCWALRSRTGCSVSRCSRLEHVRSGRSAAPQ